MDQELQPAQPDQSIPPVPPPPKKNNMVLWILLVVLLFGSGWRLYLTARDQGWLPTGTSPTPTPTVTLQPTPTPDPTADWETYSNQEVGVTFKYPHELRLSRCKDGVHLFAANQTFTEDPSQYCETPQFGAINFNFSSSAALTSGYGKSTDFKTTNTPIIVDGVSANRETVEKISGKENPAPDFGIFVTFQKGKYYFALDTLDKIYISVFDQILSTFKFSDGTASKKSCQYNGVEYKDGENFDATDGCNKCFCSDGNVGCTLIACQE